MSKSIPESVYISRIESAIAGKAIFLGWVGEFKNSKTKARLRCLIDGYEWETQLGNIINSGTGCRKCATAAKVAAALTPEAEVIAAIEVAGKVRFAGWVSGYTGIHSVAHLVCAIDGHTWEADVAQLVTPKGKSGCPCCGLNARAAKRKTPEAEVIESINARGGFVFVEWVSGYSNNRSKALLRCDCGKEWVATPFNLIHSQSACPDCSEHGYNKAKPGTLYALRSACGRWVKVGISNRFRKRLSELRGATPFQFEELATVSHDDGEEIAKLEADIHAKMTRHHFPAAFNGHTEWMEWDPALLGWLKEFDQSVQ